MHKYFVYSGYCPVQMKETQIEVKYGISKTFKQGESMQKLHDYECSYNVVMQNHCGQCPLFEAAPMHR